MQSHYSVIKELGRGVAGTVYLVRRRRDGRLFAAKEIACQSNDERRTIMKEVHLLQSVPPHPNIIQLEEVVEQRGMITVILEYAVDGTLRNRVYDANRRVSGAGIPEDDVVKWVGQLVNAFEFLHAQGIVHRDVKLENLLLSSGGNVVKIGDFGVATNVINQGKECLSRSTAGTPQYMSPEMCEGVPYTNKTDVWSLGIVAFEMCCLACPFEADNLLGLVNRITRLPCPPLPVHYSRRLDAIVHAMLLKDPTRRPSMGDVAKMLKYYRQKKASGAADGEDIGGFVVPESVAVELERIGADISAEIARTTQKKDTAVDDGGRGDDGHDGDDGGDWGEDAIGFGEEPDLLGMVLSQPSPSITNQAPSTAAPVTADPSSLQPPASDVAAKIAAQPAGARLQPPVNVAAPISAGDGRTLSDITNDQRRQIFINDREAAARNKARLLNDLMGADALPQPSSSSALPKMEPPVVAEEPPGNEEAILFPMMMSPQARQQLNGETPPPRPQEEVRVKHDEEGEDDGDAADEILEDDDSRARRLQAMRAALQEEFTRQRDIVEDMFRSHDARQVAAADSTTTSKQQKIEHANASVFSPPPMFAIVDSGTPQNPLLAKSSPLVRSGSSSGGGFFEGALPPEASRENDRALVRKLSYAEKFPQETRRQSLVIPKTKYLQEVMAEAEAKYGGGVLPSVDDPSLVRLSSSSSFLPPRFDQAPILPKSPTPPPSAAGHDFADPAAHTPSAVRKSTTAVDRSPAAASASELHPSEANKSSDLVQTSSADEDTEKFPTIHNVLDDLRRSQQEELDGGKAPKSSHSLAPAAVVASTLARIRQMEQQQLQPLLGKKQGGVERPEPTKTRDEPPPSSTQTKPAAAGGSSSSFSSPAVVSNEVLAVSSVPQDDVNAKPPAVQKSVELAAQTSFVNSAPLSSSTKTSPKEFTFAIPQPTARRQMDNQQPSGPIRASRGTPPPSGRRLSPAAEIGGNAPSQRAPPLNVTARGERRGDDNSDNTRSMKSARSGSHGDGIASSSSRRAGEAALDAGASGDRMMFPPCVQCQRKRKEDIQRGGGGGGAKLTVSPAALYCASCNAPYCEDCSTAVHASLREQHQVFHLAATKGRAVGSSELSASGSSAKHQAPVDQRGELQTQRGKGRRGDGEREAEGDGESDRSSRACCCSVM